MLAKQLSRRVFSTSTQNLYLIKQKLANVNLTPHNPEHLPG